eukprot:TRINITY_DN6856_c1_g1_i1.p1 TRINITY_DN6856_c1_g1~~TRINITY_DN6856_c1_g1_i1.p1  ORF type:complete len:118 (+),score=19.50 TRINITY_DN6856_c1_g1_i1:45-356(+)
MPYKLEKVYSAPSLGSTGSDFTGNPWEKAVKRHETRRIIMHLTAERSTMQLTSELLDTQSADTFVAELARESVRKTRLLQVCAPSKSDVPFWLRKERRIHVWR